MSRCFFPRTAIARIEAHDAVKAAGESSYRPLPAPGLKLSRETISLRVSQTLGVEPAPNLVALPRATLDQSNSLDRPESNVIDAIDRSLKDWVGSILEDVAVSLQAPGAEQADPGVSVYLLELRENRPPSSASRPPLQFALRYLVTTHATPPERAHELLGNLLFAAMENEEFGVELAPLPHAVWTAFGVAPQPAFLLDVPLRKERPEPPVGIVRHPPVINTAPLAGLRGTVTGPANVPLSGARVEIPALRLVTTTDRKGAFQFTALPAGLAIQLTVHAKGKTVSLTAPNGAGHETLLVNFPIVEE